MSNVYTELAAARTRISELERLLRAAKDMDLSQFPEATPEGYGHWDDVFEGTVQVTAWTAWQRDVDRALSQSPSAPRPGVGEGE
jgi:hypothetical protein